MRIVMPLFQFECAEKEGFQFSEKNLMIKKFDSSKEIPNIELFSKFDINYMKQTSWAIVYEHDAIPNYKQRINFLLLSFRIFFEGKTPYIKYRLCLENEQECWRLQTPITFINQMEKDRPSYSIDDLTMIEKGFANLSEMYEISTRCHNAIYFLFLSFTTIHWTASYLFFMNALEAIFSKDDRGSATKTICTRVSSFLDSKDEKTYKDIENLYNIRSDITHGRIEVNEDPLNNLQKLYKLQTIIILCMKKIVEEKIYIEFKDPTSRNKYLEKFDNKI
jgi:hypothetical protein